MEKPHKQSPEKALRQGWSYAEQVGYNQACDDWQAYHDQEMKEKETVLEAWFAVFGTTQLTHAKDRLDVAERKADKFEAEKEEWEKKYKELDNDLKAELRDPNGTIWEHAKRLQDECDRLNKGVKRILRFVELRRKSECELIFEIRALLKT